jgi:hypothetical protein
MLAPPPPVPVTVTATASELRPGTAGTIGFDLAAARTARDVVFEIDLSRLTRHAAVTAVSAGCLREGAIVDCAWARMPAGTHQHVTVGFTAKAPGRTQVTGRMIHPGTARAAATVEVAAPSVVVKARRPLESKSARPKEKEPVLAPVRAASPIPAAVTVEKERTVGTWWLATVVPAFLLLGLAAAVRRRSP